MAKCPCHQWGLVGSSEVSTITFQGGIRMKVHVVDSDDTSGDDRVDDLFVTYRATPDASLAFASPHPVTITGTRSNSPTKLVPYWNGNVILTKFSSLDEPSVPIWTSDSARDKNFAKMTFPCFSTAMVNPSAQSLCTAITEVISVSMRQPRVWLAPMGWSLLAAPLPHCQISSTTNQPTLNALKHLAIWNRNLLAWVAPYRTRISAGSSVWNKRISHLPEWI